MLTEDEIVVAVCEHLRAEGWTITSYCLGRQHGDDIVAAKDGTTLLVECKGETSGLPASPRFGEPFDSSQVYGHVAKAVLRCLRVVSEGQDQAAIAVPRSRLHLRVVGDVALALRRAGVNVYWVSADQSVRLDARL